MRDNIDWKQTLLTLRSHGVPTRKIYGKDKALRNSIERLLYCNGTGPKHWVGEEIISWWLDLGYKRSELPMRKKP